MKGYVVLIRRKEGSPTLPFKQFNREAEAELWAERYYGDWQLDMVAVLVVDTGGRVNYEKCRCIFKIERRCKHRNIQGEFIFREGITAMKCTECGMTPRREEIPV